MALSIGWPITPDGLWHMFGAMACDDSDIQRVQEKQEQIPAQGRAEADSLTSFFRFRDWMDGLTSRKLFVHGIYASNMNCPISALSVFCSKLSQALRQDPRFISLVYFCGLHADYKDPYAGPVYMMMSFIAQLITQRDFDTTFLHNYMDISWAKHGMQPNMSDLCALVKWLVGQLSRETTVFFFIDGVNSYEKNAYVRDLVDGLACILDLTIEPSIQAKVKVLVTSPGRTLELDTGVGASQRHFQHIVSRIRENRGVSCS